MNKRKYSFLLLIGFFIVSIYSRNHNMNISIIQEPKPYEKKNVIVSFQLEPHNPILIDGNADFIEKAALEGWDLGGTQDGTASKPYIISDLSITGSSDQDLISISNSDVYFKILNNTISGGDNGISLYNTSNCNIESSFPREVPFWYG
ncbi:MAG: hypothetical protein JSW11_05305 [Candidatus Heimdallarchaeota archaeon]|nr:MAG: hypothetical protein JSW11_05305 [Candidatus Heimdallarchaeota archaeon]